MDSAVWYGIDDTVASWDSGECWNAASVVSNRRVRHDQLAGFSASGTSRQNSESHGWLLMSYFSDQPIGRNKASVGSQVHRLCSSAPVDSHYDTDRVVGC